MNTNPTVLLRHSRHVPSKCLWSIFALILCCSSAVNAANPTSETKTSPAATEQTLRVGMFSIDASPLIGAPLAYDPCVEVTTPLSFRGLVILGKDEPIVMCVVDWLGVANDAHRLWRKRIADTVGTRPERVALHAIHQHDAPRCDLSAAAYLAQTGHADAHYDVPWIRDVIDKSCQAVSRAVTEAVPFDSIGMGEAEVVEVASNRRILGPDGKVIATRYTACTDPALRAADTGVVDPVLRSLSLWNDDTPIVVLTYFATHPQSYYRTGQANPDFIGLARNARQEKSNLMHIHFNGAGGNVGAGKWNDGSRENRAVLARKVEEAMEKAWAKTKRTPISPDEIDWRSLPVSLPIAPHLDENALTQTLAKEELSHVDRVSAAEHLAWVTSCKANQTIDVQCLALGNARILHMPGELFVEYQLAASQMRPDLFVCMAAYGDYGPGYIGTEIAYGQGGYETSARASRVAPATEKVLIDALNRLLNPTANN